MWMIRPHNLIVTGARDAVMRMVPESAFLSMFKPLMESVV
jgi:hypothetical protein